jgi:hypothetical protein
MPVTPGNVHYTVPMKEKNKHRLQLVAAQEHATTPAIVRRLIDNYLEKSA